MSMSSPGFSVTVSGDVILIRVDGHLDPADARHVGATMTDLVERHPDHRLVLDLTGVSLVDPGAVRGLAEQLRCVDVWPGQLSVVSRRLTARKIVRRWASDVVSIFPTVSSALPDLGDARHS